MTHSAPDTAAIGRLLDHHLAEPADDREAFMRGFRAGVEASASSIEEVAARPWSRSSRARVSIILEKAAKTLRAFAEAQVAQ